MRRRKCREVDGLYPIEQPRTVHQPDGIAGHQSTKRVSSDADLLDLLTILLQLCKPLLDLVGDPFSSHFDSIVGLVVAVALRDEDMQVIGVLSS